MVAASSDQHESGVGGDRRGCPAVASCRHPQGPSPADSHHQYESINPTDPSSVVGYRSVGPLHAIDAFDLAGRALVGEHHRKGSEAGAPTARNPPVRFFTIEQP